MPVTVKASFSSPGAGSSGNSAAPAPTTQAVPSSVTQAVGERLVPDAEVTVQGKVLPPALEAALRLIEVQQSVRLVDQAILEFENHGGRAGDQDLFRPGHEVEIKLGYVGGLAWVFKGEIVSVEPTFPVVGNPTVVVRAYDKLHRYRRGRKQRTFLEQKVSDVVKTLCSEEGLTPDVEDTKTRHAYLLQNNQTNIDFVHELARRHGYEVEVTEGKKLTFRRPRCDRAKAHTLTWGKDLKSFHVRKSLANVKTEVAVRYWNMEQKKAVTETVQRLHGKLKCTHEAPAEAREAFGDAKLMIAARPNTAPAEAEALASSVFNELALDAVRGRGTCLGEPAVQPGAVLELLGLGKTWSGLYYVTGATHVVHRHAGYSTEFRVRRHGTGYDDPVPPPAPPPAPSRERSGGGTVPREEQQAAEQEAAEQEAAEQEAEEQTKHLRLRFVDEDGEPFRDCPFELRVGGKTISGTTTANGRVVADVPADEERGEVTIWEDPDKSGDSYTWPISIKDA